MPEQQEQEIIRELRLVAFKARRQATRVRMGQAAVRGPVIVRLRHPLSRSWMPIMMV